MTVLRSSAFTMVSRIARSCLHPPGWLRDAAGRDVGPDTVGRMK